MPTPYRSYYRYNTIYKVDVYSSYYSKCVYRIYYYNLIITYSKFNYLTKL